MNLRRTIDDLGRRAATLAARRGGKRSSKHALLMEFRRIAAEEGLAAVREWVAQLSNEEREILISTVESHGGEWVGAWLRLIEMTSTKDT